MQILLALIAGAVLGIGAHYAAPRRDTRGVALGPIVGAVIGGLVWLIFTWMGVGIDSPWIWVATVVVPFPIVYLALRVLAGVRATHDDRTRARLRIS